MKQWIKKTGLIVLAGLAGFLVMHYFARHKPTLPETGSRLNYYYYVSGNDMAGWVPGGDDGRQRGCLFISSRLHGYLSL